MKEILREMQEDYKINILEKAIKDGHGDEGMLAILEEEVADEVEKELIKEVQKLYLQQEKH